MTPLIKLQPVSIEEKTELRSFLDPYLEELSAFGEFDKAYPWFDLYWQEYNRWPYWITSGGRKIGFILVNQTSRFNDPLDYFLAEFYILPEFRNHGFGERAFKEIVSLHPGQWELAFFTGYKQAEDFWMKLVKDLSYERKERENIVVLRFKT